MTTLTASITTLKNYRKALPTGALREIAEKVGLSNATVTMIFKGYESKEAPRVLEATKELLNERGIILDPEKYGETVSPSV